MESITKQLVNIGHGMSKEIAADEPAVAKLLVELSSALDVHYERGNALEARCAALAAENAGLLPKAASELSNAWVLHKYLIGIQAAIMYLDNGNKKAAQEWLYGTIAGPGFEFPDGVDDIDAWATHQMRGSVSHQQALEIIKAETPATDAFMAEVRAQALKDLCAAFTRHAEVAGLNDGDSVTLKEVIDALLHCAEQLCEGAAL